MERLFTNITNEDLTQNNNDLNTGCYALIDMDDD